LDIGCGDGVFLFELQRLGWAASGVEMDASAVQAARRQGLDARQATVEDLPFPPGSFAIVRMWHVLEHVRDPRAALTNARRLLRPGGELILGVPNVSSLYRWCFGPRWSGWDLPRHLGHFSPRTLMRLLRETGFTVVSIRSDSVGTGAGSLAALWPWCNHPVIRYPLIFLDLPLDLLGLGDALEVIAVAPP